MTTVMERARDRAAIGQLGLPTFFLGTHEPAWLSQLTDVPLFVSHRRLARRRRLPAATTPWALDSGGFTELSMYGGWRTDPSEYVVAVRRYVAEVGNLLWASPQDWMCEPIMLQRTGLTVAEHQRRTIENYLELRRLGPDLPFIPVLQGWTAADYLRHDEAYERAGIDLSAEAVVGVGTLCRRQATGQLVTILEALAARGIRMHGYGVKSQGLTQCADLLGSADSLAWSYSARMAARKPQRSVGVTACQLRNCANCLHFALDWRQRLLDRLAYQQLRLPVPTPRSW